MRNFADRKRLPLSVPNPKGSTIADAISVGLIAGSAGGGKHTGNLTTVSEAAADGYLTYQKGIRMARFRAEAPLPGKGEAHLGLGEKTRPERWEAMALCAKNLITFSFDLDKEK